MSQKKYFLFLLVTSFVFCRCEDDEEEHPDVVDQKVSKLPLEGAEYLQKVMSQLQSQRTRYQTQPEQFPNLMNLLYTQRVYDVNKEENYVTSIYNISGPTPVPPYQAEVEVVDKSPPPIPLSKEELLALYEAALGKASQLQFLQGSSQTGEEMKQSSDESVKPAFQGEMGSPVSGYYYYYFPIKSLLSSTAQPSSASKVTPAPQQIHATITMMESPNNKAIEPLFMAISGFIGMALMFLFSVLFVPKFGKIRSKAQFKDTPDEMANFAQLVLEAMAGKDCSERLACEITRLFRGLRANNKPLRVLEIILPPNMAQQISLIRKSAGKKAKCSYIPCKVKKPKPPAQEKPQKRKVAPWKKNQTPHELWMKHFEKEERDTKKQQRKELGPNRKLSGKNTKTLK